MANRKYAAIAVVFGPCADRYVVQGYTESKRFDQMLDSAKQVDGLTGIEIVGGWHIDDQNAGTVLKQINDAGFDLACVIPEIWAKPKWGWGSFASTDPGVRKEAVERVKAAMDYAASANCDMISPWFGHDGWDYVFQMDYARAYEWIIEGLVECADHNPSVNIAVEFKPKEPRTHLLVNNTAKTLLMVNEVNRKNVGINLDTGHAQYGYENLSEAVAMMKRFGDKLMHVHINDNYRYWDDDMIPGSVHTLEFMEFFHWLDRTGYDKWISLDVFGYHERNKVELAQEAVNWLDALSDAAGRMDQQEIDQALRDHDAMRSQRMLRKALLGK
jgi:xylose isomerase